MHKSRHILLPLLIMAGLLSCTPEPSPLTGRPHFWHPLPAGENEIAWPSGDTTVYVCTVSYPEGYDWLTDSTDLREGCLLKLYANEKQVLVLETGSTSGLRPDGDCHHLMGGALLSEGFRDGETLLLRNGVPLLHFSGQEKLCGYLQAEGNDYSLWRDRDGNGFTLRKNADILLRRENGRPIGDFGDTDRSGGALSLSGGTVCFAYTLPIGDETGCFLSVGGSEILLHKGIGLRFLDARLLDGRTWICYCPPAGGAILTDGISSHEFSPFGDILWQDARIIAWEGGPALLGSALLRDGDTPFCLLHAVSGELRGCGTGLCFPAGDRGQYILCYGSDRHLRLLRGIEAAYTPDGPLLWDSGESVFFPSGACASVLGERIFIGMATLGNGESCLWAGGTLWKWVLNGYICGVEAVISPPNGGS